nr:Chain P, Transcription initiation factor IIB [Mus musculus]
TGAASFDEF